MDSEVEILRSRLENPRAAERAGTEFYEGSLEGKSVVLARCGVGKVNAAMITQLLIDLYEVSAVLNTGVAGGFDPAVRVGDIVVSTEALQHDFDLTALGDPPGKIPNLPLRLPADPRLMKIAVSAGEKVITGAKIHTGLVASGDAFISRPEQRELLSQRFSPMCVEMEGAAMAHVCRLNGLPFVIIRAISDAANDEAPVSFAEFVAEAAKKSADLVTEALKEI
jgi:adenosylhomocysteine nucleosidase